MTGYTWFCPSAFPYMWENLVVFYINCVYTILLYIKNHQCALNHTSFSFSKFHSHYSQHQNIIIFRQHPICFWYKPQMQLCITCSDTSKMYSHNRFSSQSLYVKSTWMCWKKPEEKIRKELHLWNIYEDWNGKNLSQRTNTSAIIFKA